MTQTMEIELFLLVTQLVKPTDNEVIDYVNHLGNTRVGKFEWDVETNVVSFEYKGYYVQIRDNTIINITPSLMYEAHCELIDVIQHIALSGSHFSDLFLQDKINLTQAYITNSYLSYTPIPVKMRRSHNVDKYNRIVSQIVGEGWSNRMSCDFDPSTEIFLYNGQFYHVNIEHNLLTKCSN